MNREQAKREARTRLSEYLSTITTKKGKQYICPICRSGTGKNKTPAGQLNQDQQTFHCYSCNFHGDIFNLVSKIEGIMNESEVFRRVYEILNIQVEQKQMKAVNHSETRIKSAESEAITDYTSYFQECNSRAGETDYFTLRGLSNATIKKYMLGFDPNWHSPKALRDGKNPPASPRIIIPTSEYTYLARAVDPNSDPKYKALKEGTSELLNKEALWGTEPVFIVEGEIDALSIIEVGGQALSLGSTGNKRKLIQLCQNTQPLAPIILSLDNDDAGKKAQSEIADALRQLNITFIEADINGQYKDPNEALLGNKELFISNVINTAAYALQYFQEVDEIKKGEKEFKQRQYIKETSVTAQLDSFIGDIKSKVDTPTIPTGFVKLDNILDGGLYEGLYVLGAISSLGKTSFVLQVADQIAQQGQDVLIFTLEMAKTELMAKSISRLTFLECKGDIRNAKTTRGITASKRYADYSTVERELIHNSVKKYGEYTDHLFIYEGMGDIGISQIWETTETHITSTGNRPIILIDYLQILAPHEPRATDKQNTDKSVFELKRMSRYFKIPIIAISSLNRENYNTAISMSAFKESGAVEYSSDVLLGLQIFGAGKKDFNVDAEKKKNPRKIELKILKQRNGATGLSINFDYFPLFNYFRETSVEGG